MPPSPTTKPIQQPQSWTITSMESIKYHNKRKSKRVQMSKRRKKQMKKDRSQKIKER